MCGRAIGVLLSLLLLSFDGFSQCSWTPRFSGQFRTTAYDVSIDGNYVWLATGYGVELLAPDGDRVTILDSLAIPGSTRVIRADGTGLAYAGSGSKLYVVRRNGNRLQLVRSVAASGTVHDIAIASYLFAATSNGIDHFDRVDPSNPVKTNAFLATSSPNVTSLAIDRSTLYAADGDETLEMFSISIPSLPQNIGSIETVRAAAVHATAEGLVLASDAFGLNTDLFAGTTRLARMPIGMTSFAGSTQGQFIAGADRTLRAVDFTSPNRVVELFEYQLAPAGGTDNVIHDIERAGTMLYVAAGDIGLVVFDVSSIARPYPLVAYADGATTGVKAAGDQAWFSESDGTISEQTVVASGLSLAESRSWSGGSGAIVRDAGSGALLTTSGSSATLWALTANPPVAAVNFTFADAIASGVIRNDNGVVALLANGTVWSGQTKINVPKIAQMARSGAAIVLAEVNEASGKTILHYYANGDFTAEPRRFTIDGAVVGSIALDATRGAAFTFTGINVVDLASGAVTVIPQSNGAIPKQLVLAGGDLLALDATQLLVYDDARTLIRRHRLPANAIALDAASTIGVLATSDGTAALSLLAELPQGATAYGNSFHTRIAGSDDRIYLFGPDGVDVFRTSHGDALQFAMKVPNNGFIDIAAIGAVLYTLSGNGTVTSYSQAGTPLAQITLNEGDDTQPRGIVAAANAVWVSISSGCSSGACAKKTLVLDPATLAVTATLTGGIDDLFATAARAYALTDLPREIRVYDLADPLHPAQLVSTARPATARSIAAASGEVYVLGDTVARYVESSLAPAGEALDPVTPNDSMRIRTSGPCAILTGRGDDATIYPLPAFTTALPVASPSAIRSFVVQPGRLVFLTGHSVELWSTTPADPPARRRATR